MGVFSVRIGLLNGIYGVLDGISDKYKVSTSQIDRNTAIKFCGEELVTYQVVEITYGAKLFSKTRSFETRHNGAINGEWAWRDHNGALVFPNGKTAKKFASEDDALVSGHWPDGETQICIEKSLASYLEIEVGDTVTINDIGYSVIGIYNLAQIDEDYFFQYFYYLTDSHNYTFNSLFLNFSDARSAHDCYNNFNNNGYNAYVDHSSKLATTYFTLIDPIKLTLDAVCCLVMAVIVIILYTLMTLFYRQRKQYICQLKLLGAENGTILGIYLGVAIAILLIVTLLSTALGVAFSTFFLNFCEKLFQLTFKNSFNALVPFLSFLILSAITAILFAISGKKIRSDIIAQEIKSE